MDSNQMWQSNENNTMLVCFALHSQLKTLDKWAKQNENMKKKDNSEAC